MHKVEYCLLPEDVARWMVAEIRFLWWTEPEPNFASLSLVVSAYGLRLGRLEVRVMPSGWYRVCVFGIYDEGYYDRWCHRI